MPVSILGSEKQKDTTVQVDKNAGLTRGEAAAAGGFGKDGKLEQCSTLVKNPDANLLSGPANTFISLTRDEKKKTEPNAGAIWICSGLSNSLKDKAPETKEGLNQSAKPNFNLDASFIYITSKSDGDDDLGLAKGSVGNITNSAFGTIKSTNIRVIARDGIKLVTGTDKTNEKSGPKATFKGIDIIAGNDDSYLQSMVKGNNLIDFLKEAMEEISALAGTLYTATKNQDVLNNAVKNHVHTVIGAGVGVVALPIPLPVTTVVTAQAVPDPGTAVAGAFTGMTAAEFTMKDCETHKRNLKNITRRYLDPTGKDDEFVLSRYNKVN